MTKGKFLIAAALLSAAALAPNLADARHNRHHYCTIGACPTRSAILHNYGPGPQPGTFAYYDGPSTVLCRQGAAAYIGQDRRRHPCY